MRNELATGSRQSRNASATARRPTSSKTKTVKTSRCTPPRARTTPAAMAAVATLGATHAEER